VGEAVVRPGWQVSPFTSSTASNQKQSNKGFSVVICSIVKKNKAFAEIINVKCTTELCARGVICRNF
jgi:hypothetical protein